MSPASGQGQAWGRWGGRGFRVAQRQPPPGKHRLTHTATQSVLYIHSPSVTGCTNNLWEREDCVVRFSYFVDIQIIYLFTLFLSLLPFFKRGEKNLNSPDYRAASIPRLLRCLTSSSTLQHKNSFILVIHPFM